jgi:hypothetical protein
MPRLFDPNGYFDRFFPTDAAGAPVKAEFTLKGRTFRTFYAFKKPTLRQRFTFFLTLIAMAGIGQTKASGGIELVAIGHKASPYASTGMEVLDSTKTYYIYFFPDSLGLSMPGKYHGIQAAVQVGDSLIAFKKNDKWQVNDPVRLAQIMERMVRIQLNAQHHE